MKWLAIDTSTLVMGVALVDENHVLGEVTTNMKKNHSVRLMPMVARLMEELELKVSDLDAVAVASGPGSYTGVRIGVTTAKTIAWSRNIPLIGVSSLAALAMNGVRFEGMVVPLFNARRDRVYTGGYRFVEGSLKTIYPDSVLPIDQWLKTLTGKGPILFLGDDVSLFRERIVQALGDQAFFGLPAENISRASHVGWLGLKRWREEGKAETVNFAPEYLQLTEAEAKWLAQNQDGVNQNGSSRS